MPKSDGKDPDAATDEQRVVTDEVGDLVTGDVPPADAGSAQRDLLGRFMTGGGAGAGAVRGAAASPDKEKLEICAYSALRPPPGSAEQAINADQKLNIIHTLAWCHMGP